MTDEAFSRARERKELLDAYSARTDRAEAGLQALRQAFPDAPQAMLLAAVHHVFVDGTDAALDWVADAERFLRDPDPQAFLHAGRTWDAIYHLYGWLQFQALVPVGRDGVMELTAEIRQFIADNDAESALASLRQLEVLMEGSVDPPTL
ncbi:MAG TPA: hypothetical protein VGN57_04730 [Pirellulaceae bacterium]|jgi:hypothetical protein|nr:hypothetical protein [Pirellulaceae bacterium]